MQAPKKIKIERTKKKIKFVKHKMVSRNNMNAQVKKDVDGPEVESGMYFR